ncbi:hypothetical protein OAA34_00035 [bacterium]|nr:hypothetical protein [bacterium]
MAEIDVGGIKFTGGKMSAVLIALSTAAGIVWGAAEFYGDYMDMKERIQSYEAPDLSHIEQELAVQKESVNRAVGDLENIRSDTRDAFTRLYKLETETQRELLDIRKSIRTQIQEALENPLAGN